MNTIAVVTINRSAPWSKDASVSTRGHDAQVTSGIIEPSAVFPYLAEHAPELAVDPAHSTCRPDDGTYWLTGRDVRGYYTYAQVHMFESHR